MMRYSNYRGLYQVDAITAMSFEAFEEPNGSFYVMFPWEEAVSCYMRYNFHKLWPLGHFLSRLPDSDHKVPDVRSVGI